MLLALLKCLQILQGLRSSDSMYLACMRPVAGLLL